MAKRVDPEIESQVLSLNGKITQNEVAKRLGISLPTIRAICNRNGVKWKWHVADQYGEKNSSYKDGLAKSTIERLTRRVVLASGRCLRTCESCGDYNKYQEQQRHHVDRDRSNNTAENIEVLCATCHMKLHNTVRDRDENGRFLN